MHKMEQKCPRPYRCMFETCVYSASRKQALTNHVNRKHTPGRTREFKCSFCKSKFYRNYDLQRHIASHVKEKRFKCDHCPFRTHMKNYLKTHVLAKHENSVQFSCSFPCCSYSTPLSFNLKRHARIHDADPLARRPLACNFPGCNFRTSYPDSLKGHVRARHNPDRETKFTCALCTQTFFDKHNLELHIDHLHTKEKSYSCDKCPYKTYRQYNFQIHSRRVHRVGPAVEKKLKCEKCDYRGFQKLWLDIHMLAKHSEKIRYKCGHPGCNFMTLYQRAFKNHLLGHEDKLETQFPFPCSFPNCDFGRRSKWEMVAHERRHEMCKSEFKCKLCPAKCYPDSSSLSFHRRLNHIKRHFKCSLCDFAVSSKAILDKHTRQRHHTTEGNTQMSSESMRNLYRKERYNAARVVFGNSSTTNYDCPMRNCEAIEADSSVKHSVLHTLLVIVLPKISVVAL